MKMDQVDFEVEVAREEPQPEAGALRSFIAGGIGGMALVLVGHPFDTVKVRVQNSTSSASVFQVAKTTLTNEGFRGFYKGMAAPLAGVAPIFALSFLGYNRGKKMFCDDDAIEKEKFGQLAAAGFVSTFFTTPIMAPGERVKCLLQTQTSTNAKYNGSLDAFKQLYKEGGIRSVTRGFSATLLRDGVGSAVYFAGYEVMRKKMIEADIQPVVATFMSGGMAGMLNWALILPIDTVKTRFQVGTDPSYFKVIADIAKTSGIRGFFRGLSAVMMRAFPANAACFAGYEFAMYACGEMGLK
eukprot:m.12044 g.12044  ORF g.12044 m.12044 type:complete len:298 (+) comp3944_c1_seq1:59-952(+)